MLPDGRTTHPGMCRTGLSAYRNISNHQLTCRRSLWVGKIRSMGVARKFGVGLTVAVGVVFVAFAILALFAAFQAYDVQKRWAARATYTAQCLPEPVAPTTVDDCSRLAAVTAPPRIEGVEITNEDILLAGLTVQNSTGAGVLAIGALSAAVGGASLTVSGVLLATRQQSPLKVPPNLATPCAHPRG